MEKYSQYKDLYNHSTTLPIKGLRGKKIDLSMAGTALGIFILSAVLINLLVPGDTVFGVQKIWIIVGVTAILVFLSNKIDTASYPFFLYVFSIIHFFIKKTFKKKALVGFEEVEYPSKKLTIDSQISYRDIRSDGKETSFYMYPLEGVIDDIKGMHMEVEDATKITYNPLSKKMKIQVGKYENLKPQTVPLTNKPLNMEIGSGELKVLFRQGKHHAIYTPKNEIEEARNGKKTSR